MQGPPGHLTVTADYFFNNDLEFLKTSDPEKMYTTSITKTKATRSQMNKFSKHNVYSTQKILCVKSVSVKKLHGYGHLEEIVVKRAHRQLYKFKEGDFMDLHLNDSDIVDFKEGDFMDLHFFLFNTSYSISMTVTLLTLLWLFADELYKFSDETLKTIRDKIHHRILDFLLRYNKEMSRRKWTATNKKRSELMVELIDKQMRERRIIKNLERLVGARELEMDYKLMTRTV
ncbi:hypothetical protein Tco_0950987 [Tanacetum coccineum]|uniref:Uncharacterized protein n=1 Tax=Tanacetum coccineum TaxID=301880 RepID=A0ABQ5DVB1_9ASTR